MLVSLLSAKCVLAVIHCVTTAVIYPHVPTSISVGQLYKLNKNVLGLVFISGWLLNNEIR